MSGVVAAALVAHVPTLGRSENTPDYQRTLVQAERKAHVVVVIQQQLCASQRRHVELLLLAAEDLEA